MLFHAPKYITIFEEVQFVIYLIVKSTIREYVIIILIFAYRLKRLQKSLMELAVYINI